MKDSCAVSLSLVAKAGTDPAEITTFVGVEPTEIRPGQRQSHVWELTLKGPSPVNAGRVANDLALRLLARVGAAGRDRESWIQTGRARAAEVTFRFHFGRLLNFSYEFDREVIRGLADLGALVAFYHYDAFRDQAPMVRFGSGASLDEGCDVSLRISGDDLDPEIVTSRLGIAPSSTGRKGEPAGPRSTRIYPRSFWLLDGASPRSRNADEPIGKLVDRLPTKSEVWRSLASDHKAHVMVAFRVREMTGHFDLDASTLSTIADCQCGLDASFYDWGPRGLDLLG
jgi:hypothetical protein